MFPHTHTHTHTHTDTQTHTHTPSSLFIQGPVIRPLLHQTLDRDVSISSRSCKHVTAQIDFTTNKMCSHLRKKNISFLMFIPCWRRVGVTSTLKTDKTPSIISCFSCQSSTGTMTTNKSSTCINKWHKNQHLL